MRRGSARGVLIVLSVPFLLFVAMATAFGPLCSWLAQRRARSWAVWFVYGAILGPIAVGLLLAAPPGRCPSCGTPTRGWPNTCDACGLAFDGSGESPAGAADTLGLTAAADERRMWGTPVGPGRPAARGDSSRATSSTAGDDVEAAVMDSPETRPATRLGRRALAVAGRSSSESVAAPRTLAILGSGVFVGGSDELQIGSRYFLARVGGELHALGPIHMSPSAIAIKMKLNDAEATVVSDRVLITGKGKAAGRTLAFAGVAMEPGMDLQRELAGRRRQRVATS